MLKEQTNGYGPIYGSYVWNSFNISEQDGVGKYGRGLVYERKRAYSQRYTVYKAAR
jgi:hypothetical protein